MQNTCHTNQMNFARQAYTTQLHFPAAPFSSRHPLVYSKASSSGGKQELKGRSHPIHQANFYRCRQQRHYTQVDHTFSHATRRDGIIQRDATSSQDPCAKKSKFGHLTNGTLQTWDFTGYLKIRIPKGEGLNATSWSFKTTLPIHIAKTLHLLEKCKYQYKSCLKMKKDASCHQYCRCHFCKVRYISSCGLEVTERVQQVESRGSCSGFHHHVQQMTSTRQSL